MMKSCWFALGYEGPLDKSGWNDIVCAGFSSPAVLAFGFFSVGGLGLGLSVFAEAEAICVTVARTWSLLPSLG